MKKLLIAGLAVVGSAASAFAATDYTGMVTSVTAEISPAVTAALPIAGTILAIGLGVKLFRRFVK